MILFLDFDGVTHGLRCAPNQIFDRLPLLEEFLRLRPEIEIVITSTWRFYYPFAALKQFFSPDIADRVIGVTSVADQYEYKKGEGASREAEVLAYLEEHNLKDRDWLILDDGATQFPNFLERVISPMTYVGIDDDTIQELTEKVEKMTTR